MTHDTQRAGTSLSWCSCGPVVFVSVPTLSQDPPRSLTLRPLPHFTFHLDGGSLGHPPSPLLPPPWTLPPLGAVCTCIPPSQASARGSRHCCPLSALLSVLYVLRPRPLLWSLPFPSPVLSPLPESPALIHGPCVNFEVVLPMPPFHL